MTRLGAVIIFQQSITQEQAEAALQNLEDAGIIETAFRGYSRVNEFDPEYGGPVWYIP